MSKRSTHIDQLYKEQLGGYSEMPPASVWESLEQRLDEHDDKGGGYMDDNGNGRPRFPMRWWWVLLGLLLLVGTAVGINKLVERAPHVVTTVQNTTTSTTPAPTSAAPTASADDNKTEEDNKVARNATDNKVKANANTTPSAPKVKSTTSTENKTQAKASSTNNKTQTTASSSTTTSTTTTTSATSNSNTVQKSNSTQTNNKTEQEKNVTQQQKTNTATTNNTPSTTTQKEVPASVPTPTIAKVDTQEPATKEEDESITTKTTEQTAKEPEPQQEVKTTTNDEIEQAAQTKETQQKENTIVAQEEGAPIQEASANTEEEKQEATQEEAVAAKEAEPTKTKTTEEVAETEPAKEIATEEEVEEAPQNELAYLSESSKQQKKAKRRKEKQQIEVEENTDDLGINEYNTLTPTPPKPRKWEIGIKAGYEYGFNNNAKADKFVFSPYLQYMVVPHFSLVFQPSYLWGNAKVNITKPAEDYYDVRSTSLDSTLTIVKGDTIGVKPDTLIATYIYGKVYDSTHVNYQLKQKQIWSIELPIMLQYDITSSFSVYGGVSFDFSKVVSYQQNRFDNRNLTLIDTVVSRQDYPSNQLPPSPPQSQDPASYFANNGTPISQYKPYVSNTQSSFTRVGFMLGFRYTFADRYMVDLLLKQAAVNKSVITDVDLQKIYSQPYMRITLGYKLFK